MKISEHIEKLLTDSSRRKYKEREEIEIKYIIPKKVLSDLMVIEDRNNTKKAYIEQFYLSEKYFEEIFSAYPKLNSPGVNEIRIRKKNDDFFITAKGPKSKKKYIRYEAEEESLSKEEYNSLKVYAVSGIKKIRYSYKSQLADAKVRIDLDDYVSNDRGELRLDFFTCEVEVPSDKYAQILISGKFFVPELKFLHMGFHTAYDSGFSNREISEKGFPRNDFQSLSMLIRNSRLKKIRALSEKAIGSKNATKILREIEILSKNIREMDKFLSGEYQEPEGIGSYQNILENFKFRKEQSLGSEYSSNRLCQLDKIGKGWSQDFHTITTSSPFRRLFLKPQVFRVNEGSVNTSTRGTHALDVISISQQLCKHLGLNEDFASAMAALHDIGHAPFGHIGEEVLSKLSRKRFYHHYFSLSLAEIFDMNLLKEVLLGAALHKTSGEALQLKNQPLEIAIVRIADKISYVPRDIFDGILNGYIEKEDIPKWIFEQLGDTPERWLEKFIDTVVKESALEHNVNFSKKSGVVFDAFKFCHKIIFKKLHSKIHWKHAKLNIEIAYRYNEIAFSELDPVVITAYMTDEEVNRLANLVESSPVGYIFPEFELKARGFGFLDIVEAMLKSGFDESRIYYSRIPKKLIKRRGI